MKEYDVFVNGRKYHVRETTLGKYVVSIPNARVDPIVHERDLFKNPRQATNNSENLKPHPEDAAIISRLKLRQQTPEMSRSDRRKIQAIVMADLEREGKARTEIVRKAKRRQETLLKKPCNFKHPMGDSRQETCSFDKIEEEPEQLPPFLDRYKKRW